MDPMDAPDDLAQHSLWDRQEELRRVWLAHLAAMTEAERVAWDDAIEARTDPRKDPMANGALPPGYSWHNGLAMRSAGTASWGRGLSKQQKRVASNGRHPGSGEAVHPNPAVKCKGCAHLQRFKRSKVWYKCNLQPYGTWGPATDVRVGWRACTSRAAPPDDGGLL